MTNHPNRGKRRCWAQFLPEIGEVLIAEIEEVQELEKRARDARKTVEATIYKNWTPNEIIEAKRAANAGCLTKAF